MVVVFVCFYKTGSHVALACFQLIGYLRMTYSWPTPCIRNNLVERKEPIGLNFLCVLLFSHCKENWKEGESFFCCPTQHLLSCHPYSIACHPLLMMTSCFCFKKQKVNYWKRVISINTVMLKQGMSSTLLGSHGLVIKCMGCEEWWTRFKFYLIICCVTLCFSICMVEMVAGDTS